MLSIFSSFLFKFDKNYLINKGNYIFLQIEVIDFINNKMKMWDWVLDYNLLISNILMIVLIFYNLDIIPSDKNITIQND